MFNRVVPSLQRSFSTSATVAQLVKAPVQVHGVEGRYATALYSAASKNKELEKVDAEMKKIKSLYDSDRPFREFLRDPTLKRVDKKKAIGAVMKKLNHSQTTTNLAELMAENGRLPKMDGVTRAFATLMAAHRGEVVCEVTTAKPLDNAMTAEVQAALQAFMKPGQKALMVYKVNPALLGGMTVTVGDRFADMSLVRKIKYYEKVIQTAIV